MLSVQFGFGTTCFHGSSAKTHPDAGHTPDRRDAAQAESGLRTETPGSYTAHPWVGGAGTHLAFSRNQIH